MIAFNPLESKGQSKSSDEPDPGESSDNDGPSDSATRRQIRIGAARHGYIYTKVKDQDLYMGVRQAAGYEQHADPEDVLWLGRLEGGWVAYHSSDGSCNPRKHVQLP